MHDVICIVGMHRSGTSMVARHLQQRGLYLGSDDELLGPNEANLLGHFEHRGLLEVNEEVLSVLGGSLYAPPDLDGNWSNQAALQPITEKAQRIIAKLEARAPWGWKDPRTSLLIPFWKSLISNLRFVICVRNPLEVALSLEKRQAMAISQGAWLWHRYMSAAIHETEGHPRLFVFYDDFLSNASHQSEKLAQFCRLGPVESTSQAREVTLSDLRHHRVTIVDLLKENEIVPDAKILYVGLRALALERHMSTDTSPAMENGIELRAFLDAYGDQNRYAQAQSEIVKLEMAMERLTAEKELLSANVDSIKRTLSWQIVAQIEAWKEKLLPTNSSRRRAYELVLKTLKSRGVSIKSMH